MSKPAGSWPFVEAAKIDLKGLAPEETVVFESGFGPSGLPHIGTFAEVARTLMVKNAFEESHPGRPTALYAFCDDMDGLRKVPLNVPDREALRPHLGKPLVNIPDPFGTDPSYAAHMERLLDEFLSRFGFKFELKSSAAEYQSGAFNRGLHLVLEHYERIRAVITPTLQEENREEWSPLIPICEKCGKLYTTVVTGHDPAADTVRYECRGAFGQGENRIEGCGHVGETSALSGQAKVGWKVDWALRWFTYQVRYEMYGKDLIDSAKLSSKLCRIIGGVPPAGMVYELFLDEGGGKISKSVGEGLTVDSWMTYAPIESLLHFLFQNPKRQRRLYFDVIPKSVDEYLDLLRKYPELDDGQKMDTVVWHARRVGRPPVTYGGSIDFSLVLNLISALGAGDRDLLFDYLLRYDPQVADHREMVDKLVDRAVAYFRDFIEPNKKYRAPTADERPWFEAIVARLEAAAGLSEDELQAICFDVAREQGADAKAVFKAFYEVVLGQERGPRFGTFAKLVGTDRAAQMLRAATQKA